MICIQCTDEYKFHFKDHCRYNESVTDFGVMQVPIHDFGKTHIKRLQASPSWTSENGDCFFPYEEQCKVGHKMKSYHLRITIIIPKPNYLDYHHHHGHQPDQLDNSCRLGSPDHFHSGPRSKRGLAKIIVGMTVVIMMSHRYFSCFFDLFFFRYSS